MISLSTVCIWDWGSKEKRLGTGAEEILWGNCSFFAGKKNNLKDSSHWSKHINLIFLSLLIAGIPPIGNGV